MNYLIKANEVTKITETSGTLQNISQLNAVELSESAEFTNNIILYPLQKVSFQTQLYARLSGGAVLPVELRVIPIQLDGGGSSGGGDTPSGTIATNAEFEEMLDEVLPTVEGGDITPTVPSGAVATDEEFDDLLDDLGL